MALTFFLALFGAGCAHTPATPVSREHYAAMSHQRDYDYELPVVWKAVLKTVENFKITDQNSYDDAHRSIQTDWSYSQSRDKHQTTTLNGRPNNVPLQVRLKYKIQADRLLGGAHVTVHLEEELETLNLDGSSAGFHSVPESEQDSSRPNDILDRIALNIVSAAP